MPYDRIRDPVDKSARSLRCGISAIGVVLIAFGCGISFASATPLEEAAGTAGSVVTPATGASAPSLPSAPPSATSPMPIAAPTVPPIHASQVPVKVPTRVMPTSSPSSYLAPAPSGGATKISGLGARLPSNSGTTSPANEPAGRVTGASTKATQRVAASVRNDAGAGSDSPSGPGPRATTAEVGLARSVEAALPHWFAYVWPAIALGRSGKVLAAFLASGEGKTSRSASDLAQSLFRLSGITWSNDASTDNASTISQRPATPIGPLAAPTAEPVPGGGMNLFLTMVTSLLALIALIALARLVVGEELFPSLRWPQ
jgi:hypothetical protein